MRPRLHLPQVSNGALPPGQLVLHGESFAAIHTGDMFATTGLHRPYMGRRCLIDRNKMCIGGAVALLHCNPVMALCCCLSAIRARRALQGRAQVQLRRPTRMYIARGKLPYLTVSRGCLHGRAKLKRIERSVCSTSRTVSPQRQRRTCNPAMHECNATWAHRPYDQNTEAHTTTLIAAGAYAFCCTRQWLMKLPSQA